MKWAALTTVILASSTGWASLEGLPSCESGKGTKKADLVTRMFGEVLGYQQAPFNQTIAQRGGSFMVTLKENGSEVSFQLNKRFVPVDVPAAGLFCYSNNKIIATIKPSQKYVDMANGMLSARYKVSISNAGSRTLRIQGLDRESAAVSGLYDAN